jgi:hypothetical protein
MTIMKVDGFERSPVWITEGLLEDKQRAAIKNITTFMITSPGWENISVKVTDIAHLFHFTAANPKVGSIEALIDVSHQDKPKRIILQRTGLSNAIDILLDEAERLVTQGYWATQPKPIVKKLIITRYHFNMGACEQRYVEVHRSKTGRYVVPGYHHGLKPEALGQFYHHKETAVMLSLPENIERDRRHFDRCMFRLIRRKTREINRQAQRREYADAIVNKAATQIFRGRQTLA